MNKRWHIIPFDRGVADHLHEVLKVSPVLCRMLAQRGIHDFEEARNFFRPSLDKLHSPWLMKDMEKAVARIRQALDAEEKVLVFGDYDVDGTTAVASTFQFLSRLFPENQIDYYIPHRYKEGYGISMAGIEFAAAHQYSLIIALDCGIKSTELIAWAKSMGIDFIVCDHHLPGPELPPAAAILNPKQPDCTYPYKELCGCGVGYKLISALQQELNLPTEWLYEPLDLLATAIAADIVPITGENRILAYHGLHKINTEPNPGLHALISLAKANTPLQITNVVFIIAPRINAAGRMDDARKAVSLFLETDPDKAMTLAETLQQDNSNRKEADREITEEALEMVRNDVSLQEKKTSVLFQEHWHKGVVGIVASRMIEHFYRPTVVLTRSGDILAGSARSVPGFNLYEAIYACREHLLGYGGHMAAAGLSLAPENLEAFTQRFEEVVSASIQEELLVPEIKIDAEVKAADLTEPLYNLLSQMEPFGPDNMKPVFLIRNAMVCANANILKEQHIRFSIRQNSTQRNVIGFGMSHFEPYVQEGKLIDLVFHLDINQWNGEKHLQLRLLDLKPSSATDA